MRVRDIVDPYTAKKLRLLKVHLRVQEMRRQGARRYFFPDRDELLPPPAYRGTASNPRPREWSR